MTTTRLTVTADDVLTLRCLIAAAREWDGGDDPDALHELLTDAGELLDRVRAAAPTPEPQPAGGPTDWTDIPL